jgi:methanethiol S-methyltransferase
MITSLTTQVPHRTLVHRLAIFAYGVVAYAIGVAALLALIVSMLGLVQFTGGTLGQLDGARALAVDALLLVGFAVQHSLMARPAFKAWWTRIIPAACERSTYVLATGLVLLPMLALWQPMPDVVWSVQAPIAHWWLLAVAVMGWTYLFAASFAINHFELFGLQQAWLNLRGRRAADPQLRQPFFYRWVAHPLYSGFFLAFWAAPEMTVGHLLLPAGMSAFMLIAIRYEERDLTNLFGEDYRRYRSGVGMLTPRFRRRSA